MTREEQKKVDSYVLINHEYDLVHEMALWLKVDDSAITRSLAKQGLKALKRGSATVEYIRENVENKTVAEVAAELKISQAAVKKACRKHGIAWLVDIKRTREFNRSIAPKENNYWPAFKELTDKQMDGLMQLAAEAIAPLSEEERKERRKSIVRPRAEYDIIVKSDTLREYLDSQGYHIKK